ncbi:MAG: helix-turn-helix domain-containing protein [Planctomycetota bacterium]
MATATAQPDQLRASRGEALRKARKAAALSAERLAEFVNERTTGTAITKHAIYSYEQGKVLLSREVGHRIAQALQLHPGQLLLGDPDYRSVADANARTVESDSAVEHALEAELGVAVEMRVELVMGAQHAIPTAQVLARLLGSAKLGRVDIAGHLDVFHLLLEDTTPLIDSLAATAVRDFGDEAGNEHPFALLQAIEQLHDVVAKALEQLIDPHADTALSRHRLCMEQSRTLGQLAQTLAGEIDACNKRLPGVSLDMS